MERTRDRYRNANEIENDARRSAQDPGRQTLTSSLAANGPTSFPTSSASSRGEGATAGATPQAEDSFDIHLLGFASTGDGELDALYQEAEAYLASRDGVEAGAEQAADEQADEQGEQAPDGEHGEASEQADDSEQADASEQADEVAADASTGESSVAASKDKRGDNRSEIIPELPDQTVDAATGHLDAGRKQKAIDVLLTAAKQRGRVDVRLLHRRRMRYDPKLGLDGAAYYPRERKGEVAPTKVNIGETGLDKGAPWLYSTMLHEYQHVLQYQGKRGRDTRAPGIGGKLLGKQQETEAYARELILSRKTGVAQDEFLMTRIWNLMQGNWQHLSGKGRKPLRKMMDHARHIYRRVVRKARIGSSSEGE